MQTVAQTPQTLSGKELLAASRLAEALRHVREDHPNINAMQARVLLLLAQMEGSSLRELVKASAEKQSTVSRVLLDMTRYARTKGAVELVQVEPDEHDLRVHRFTLNDAGRALVKKFLGGL